MASVTSKIWPQYLIQIIFIEIGFMHNICLIIFKRYSCFYDINKSYIRSGQIYFNDWLVLNYDPTWLHHVWIRLAY